MQKGDIIKHVDLGDKFYLVFDVTDSYHEIEIGSAFARSKKNLQKSFNSFSWLQVADL